MIEVQTRLGQEELMSLNRFHLFRRNRVLLVCMMLVLLGMFAWLAGKTGGIITVLVGLVVVALYVPLVWMIVVLQVRRIAKTSPMISDQTRVTFRFGPENLQVQVDKPGMQSLATMDWNQVWRIWHTKDCWFLYVSTRQSHIVPRKDVAPADLAALETLLNEKAAALGRKPAAPQKELPPA